jgi:hypothetical protein
MAASVTKDGLCRPAIRASNHVAAGIDDNNFFLNAPEMNRMQAYIVYGSVLHTYDLHGDVNLSSHVYTYVGIKYILISWLV